MNSIAEYLEHPQLAGRDLWREIGSPAGPLRALIPPVRMEGVEPVMGAMSRRSDSTPRPFSRSWASTRESMTAWRREGAI